jgi:hypothetical protein
MVRSKKDGFVYVSTTERVSKSDKTAAKGNSGCQGVREMTHEETRFQDLVMVYVLLSRSRAR